MQVEWFRGGMFAKSERKLDMLMLKSYWRKYLLQFENAHLGFHWHIYNL